MTVRTRKVIGWREWVRLPDLGVRLIKAKVDTGARTSSLHAEDIRHVQRRGEPWVKFRIRPKQRKKKPCIEAIAPLVEERRVRSSSGSAEKRPVIRTSLDLGDDVQEIELTLTNRDIMGFRMLLGRQAVRGRAVVDPGRSFLTRKVRTKKKRKKRSP